MRLNPSHDDMFIEIGMWSTKFICLSPPCTIFPPCLANMSTGREVNYGKSKSFWTSERNGPFLAIVASYVDEYVVAFPYDTEFNPDSEPEHVGLLHCFLF